MDDQLLTTRLAIPPQSQGWLPRAHLRTALHGVTNGETRLGLISAPAGSGKTTLLSQWIAGLVTVKVAWLSLDASDNQGMNFWLYLMGALQTALPGVGQAERLVLAFPQAPPLEPLLVTLLNQVAVSSLRAVLVLDDYHLVTNPAIHAGIAFLLEHLPSNLALVIATRADPPLALSRLRVRGQLVEVRASDLAFTPAEARQFLNDRMALNLGEADLDAIARRTEGWAAGVQLAAVALQAEQHQAQSSAPASFVRRLAGSPQIMLDYLVDEVLSQQPQSVQRFLLFTSILDELNPLLVEAVCQPEPDRPPPIGDGGSMNSGAINGYELLASLARANLFVIPLASPPAWVGGDLSESELPRYRYHTLFAEALQSRLAQTYPRQIPQLHRRASQWNAAHGRLDAAIRHALAAGDDQSAADLLEGSVAGCLKRGQYAAVLDWLAHLPEAVVAARPGLAVSFARALALTGRLKEAAGWLDSAEKNMPDSLPGVDALRGQVASIRATIAVMHNHFRFGHILTRF